MYKSGQEMELELGMFGAYLLKSRIVNEKHAPYYVKWVRRYLTDVPTTVGANLEDRIKGFLQRLAQYYQPWQLDQAEKAVRLYCTHYLTKGGKSIAVVEVKPDDQGCYDRKQVLEHSSQLIQLRHYSRTTEQTYVGWMNRYFRYQAECSKPVKDDFFPITPQSVQDYPDQCFPCSTDVASWDTGISVRHPAHATSSNTRIHGFVFIAYFLFTGLNSAACFFTSVSPVAVSSETRASVEAQDPLNPATANSVGTDRHTSRARDRAPGRPCRRTPAGATPIFRWETKQTLHRRTVVPWQSGSKLKFSARQFCLPETIRCR